MKKNGKIEQSDALTLGSYQTEIVLLTLTVTFSFNNSAWNETNDVKANNTTYDGLNYLKLCVQLLTEDGKISEEDMNERVIVLFQKNKKICEALFSNGYYNTVTTLSIFFGNAPNDFIFSCSKWSVEGMRW